MSGDVYERKDAPVLRKMRDYIKTVESSETHVFRNALTSMPID